MVQPLFNALEGDDFSLHEEVRCLSAIFPSDYRARIVECFAADARDRARRGAAGFLLDPDEAIALAAVRGLAASAARRGLDVVSRRRVALIRPWLPAARREALDRAFPPGDSASEEASASVVKTVASACDGSGAATLIATVKRGARFAVVALMTKPSGIADSYLVEDLPKVKAEALAVSARGGSTCAETPFETWLRLLRLALGRNLASGSPPPFGAVQAMEALGLESLVPDVSTTADVIDSLLADFPARNDADMIEEAHKAVLGAEAAGDWFEAGEAVEDLLRPTANPEAGARALLENSSSTTARLLGEPVRADRPCAGRCLARVGRPGHPRRRPARRHPPDGSDRREKRSRVLPLRTVSALLLPLPTAPAGSSGS